MDDNTSIDYIKDNGFFVHNVKRFQQLMQLFRTEESVPILFDYKDCGSIRIRSLLVSGSIGFSVKLVGHSHDKHTVLLNTPKKQQDDRVIHISLPNVLKCLSTIVKQKSHYVVIIPNEEKTTILSFDENNKKIFEASIGNIVPLEDDVEFPTIDWTGCYGVSMTANKIIEYMFSTTEDMRCTIKANTGIHEWEMESDNTMMYMKALYYPEIITPIRDDLSIVLTNTTIHVIKNVLKFIGTSMTTYTIGKCVPFSVCSTFEPDGSVIRVLAGTKINE